MTTHPFGYVAVILVQQLVMVGMLWAIVHLVDRLHLERRRQTAVMPFSNASASADFAALAVQLARTGDRNADPVPRRARVREMHEERA